MCNKYLFWYSKMSRNLYFILVNHIFCFCFEDHIFLHFVHNLFTKRRKKAKKKSKIKGNRKKEGITDRSVVGAKREPMAYMAILRYLLTVWIWLTFGKYMLANVNWIPQRENFTKKYTVYINPWGSTIWSKQLAVMETPLDFWSGLVLWIHWVSVGTRKKIICLEMGFL